VNYSQEPGQALPSQPPAPIIDEKLVTPVVTYVILVLTVLIYLLQAGTEVLAGYDIPALFGMKINEAIIAGQLWRLVTPMLLHGSVIHIGFNMYALMTIGSNIEKRFGHGRFLLLYLMGAFAGNVFSFLLSPNPSLGASTSIFGLLGAEMVFFYQNRKIFGSGARSALQNVISVAAINLLIGLSGGIDNWGHLGGLLGGLVFTWFAGPRLNLEGVYPYFKVIDERGTEGQLVGTGLVLLFFGALAALKIWGIGPF
jgi:rhomboid protease GluP